jgi:amino acid permease
VFVGYGGIELVAVAAGEAARPYRSVPRATKATFWRIIIFYLLTVLTLGLWMDVKDDTWQNDEGLIHLLTAELYSHCEIGLVTTSPVTLVFQKAGFGSAAHLINAVILTAGNKRLIMDSS